MSDSIHPCQWVLDRIDRFKLANPLEWLEWDYNITNIIRENIDFDGHGYSFVWGIAYLPYRIVFRFFGPTITLDYIVNNATLEFEPTGLKNDFPLSDAKEINWFAGVAIERSMKMGFITSNYKFNSNF